MIHVITGAGIGLFIGLLARPFLDAFIATRIVHDALVDDAAEEEAAPRVKSS